MDQPPANRNPRVIPAPVTAPPRAAAAGSSRPPEPRWPWLTWPVALGAFLVPLVLLGATLGLRSLFGSSALQLAVTDQYSGASLPGVTVQSPLGPLLADAEGRVAIPDPTYPIALTVTADGYAPVAVNLDADPDAVLPIALRPTFVTGVITDKVSGAPLQGALVRAVGPDGTGPEALTGADGRYRIDNVPAGATLRVEAGDFGTIEQQIGGTAAADFALLNAVVRGKVTDKQGVPVPNVRVIDPTTMIETVTDANGDYRLVSASVSKLQFNGSGFEDLTVEAQPGATVDAVLEPYLIKSLYVGMNVLVDPVKFEEVLRIADETEINAIVIDVKQDNVFYDTQVEFFRNIPDVVVPLYDPYEMVQKLHDRGLYVIARMVVFKDPLVALGRPDLAVIDEVTGQPWEDYQGLHWVNAFYPELWQANADLAAELAQIGFDEVQYDYIRFPSDGDLTTAEFGNDYTEELRREAITNAVRMGSEATRANGAKFAVDLFPIIAIIGNDQGIGQTVQDLTPLVDYVCLMAYPSHYAEGNIPVDGHPNDFPAETITYTLERAEELVPGTMKKMRPWLQDFNYKAGLRDYTPEDVRAQIDAAEAMGASGWLLWNPVGEFEVAALDPE